jgi:hypothetical protein
VAVFALGKREERRRRWVMDASTRELWIAVLFMCFGIEGRKKGDRVEAFGD